MSLPKITTLFYTCYRTIKIIVIPEMLSPLFYTHINSGQLKEPTDHKSGYCFLYLCKKMKVTKALIKPTRQTYFFYTCVNSEVTKASRRNPLCFRVFYTCVGSKRLKHYILRQYRCFYTRKVIKAERFCQRLLPHFYTCTNSEVTKARQISISRRNFFYT